MKLAVIARVNGGLDIIEPFVRHHVQHFDKLISSTMGRAMAPTRSCISCNVSIAILSFCANQQLDIGSTNT